ncbi:MAG: AAA family ATPase [Terriglobales bacterium]|jgi:hypothetical protein
MDSQFGLITGAAGCGKTYTVRQQLNEDSGWGLLTATTGVAARNLGDNVPTIHSALGFFDITSLRTLSMNGDLAKAMRKVKKHHERIVIDEASMLTREALQVLHNNAEAVGLGLWLVGDFLQLPPIVRNDETPSPWWAFQALCWPSFANNTRWLTTNYRQSNPEFLAGLNHLRSGHGNAATATFRRCGVNFTRQLDYKFPGVTIVATNRVRGEFNDRMYAALDETEVIYQSERWGKQPSAITQNRPVIIT